MEYVIWVLSFGVMVGVLVVVHEAGHFLVAKAFGIGAPVFSIGIGPPLFRLFSWRGTDFVVSGLPIGGYVKLAGADPFGEEDVEGWVDPKEDFMRRPVWQRFLVMVAGPAMNLVLPYVLFTAVLVTGEPQGDNSIGTVIPGTPAAEIGLRPGDRVVGAAGVEVDVWSDLVRELDDHVGAPVPLDVERGGERLALTLPAGAVRLSSDGLVDTEALGFWQSRRTSRIGVADAASPAWKAGLRPGDAILEVDGVPVSTFEELMSGLAEPVPHKVKRGRATPEKLEVEELALEPDPSWQSPWAEVDPNPWGLVHGSVFIGGVEQGSAADQAGIRLGDRMLSIDGKPVRSWSDVLHYVAAAAPGAEDETATARPLDLVLIRDGVEVPVTLTPNVRRDVDNGEVRFRPIMGVLPFSETFTDGPQIKKFYDLPTAFGRAVEETNYVFERTFAVLGGFATGDLKFRESIGGPVEIFRVAGASAKEGVFTFVRMIGMISVSLGIVNLLPVPVLDGGQIAVYGIEALRGRPLSLRVRERIQMVGVLVLAALLLMATVMDFQRLLQG